MEKYTGQTMNSDSLHKLSEQPSVSVEYEKSEQGFEIVRDLENKTVNSISTPVEKPQMNDYQKDRQGQEPDRTQSHTDTTEGRERQVFEERITG